MFADNIRCTYPEAACVTRRLFNFFHLNFRYEEANLFYRHIAILVNASLPTEEQCTVERLTMEILEAQNDLFRDRFAIPIQEILDRCYVKAATLDQLSEDQADERSIARRGALQSLRMHPLVNDLEMRVSRRDQL